MVPTRPLTVDDVPALCALINRARAADGVKQAFTEHELTENLSGEAYDLTHRSLAALAPDGTVVGFVTVEHRPAAVLDLDEQTCHLDGGVDPQWRRQGIGEWLFGWATGIGRDLLMSIDDDLPKRVCFGAYDSVPGVAHLAARAGYVEIRAFEELLRPLDLAPPVTEVDGVRIEPWPDGRDEQLRAVKNEAFRDHWGSSLTAAQDWHQQLHGHAGRTDLSFVAFDEPSGEPVAVLVSARYPEDDDVLARREAWIQTLGTLRPWRGRGVASALIGRALAAFAADGLTHASITVDSDSLTGAAQLYRSLGFVLQRRSVFHQLEIRCAR